MKKYLMLGLATISLAFSVGQQQVAAAPEYTWEQQGTEWIAKKDGQILKDQWLWEYYLTSDGTMAHDEWIYDANCQSWFYITADGTYAWDEWVGSYYLEYWGYMAKNEWIYDENYQSWFYIEADGSYAHEEWANGYYFKEWGYMAKNEWVYDHNYDNWFYFKADGAYAHDEWIDGYYLASDGQLSEAVVNQQILDSFNYHYGINGDHAFYYQDLSGKTNEAFGVNENTPIRSASIIKLLIMVAFFQDVEEGLIDLDEIYYLKAEDIVGGSGNLQVAPIGTGYSYRHLIHEVMYTSDNIAANAIIERLGGVAATREKIHQLGFMNSSLNRKLLDTKALQAGRDNYVAAKDLATALERIYHYQMVSPKADQHMLDLLQESPLHRLAKRLPWDVTRYNKTGTFHEYGTYNDAGIFVTDKGAYVLVAITTNGTYQQKVTAAANFGYDVYYHFQQQ